MKQPPMPPRSRHKRNPNAVNLTWSKDTELIGLTLQLQPLQDSSLYPQYTIGRHSWFLDQVRQADPDLSAYMHDGESEKPFTISGLQGLSSTSSRSHSLSANQTYDWTITALSQTVVQWLWYVSGFRSFVCQPGLRLKPSLDP
ncbi:hypothetical protein [Leptolyngbya sp. FACHB-541]|uniref:hypothetical protein n=1 Tax=Leptolyngbya sp. FACHB-541 TaxID=2692810 RepID=UPI001686AAD4